MLIFPEKKKQNFLYKVNLVLFLLYLIEINKKIKNEGMQLLNIKSKFF